MADIYSIFSVLNRIYWTFKDAGTLLMFISPLNIHNLNPWGPPTNFVFSTETRPVKQQRVSVSLPPA